MKLRKFNIDLDTKLKKSNLAIEVVQGDQISNILEINLFQDDEPYLLDGLSVTTVFNKSDNTTVIQSSEDLELPILIEENKVTITLKSNSISASGLVVAEVLIYGNNDERLTSQRFTFYVRESLLSDDVIESTNEFPVLVSLIKDVRGLLEKQIEMVESETIRVSNEVERIKTHEKLLILQSNLETLQISLENAEEQRESNELARENLKTSLESLQGDLLALEIEIANSIDIANQSATNADDKANLAQTATDNINSKLIEVNNLIDEIVTDEQERILAENERISNENERIENEGIRDTEFTNKINDFVAETERVENEYPLRLTDVEEDLATHKEDYTTQRQQDQFKVATVEKGLNDYKSTMTNINVNQEAKQKVTGYGVVSLPKNAANGNANVSLKGNTVTDETGTKSTVSASRLKSVGKNLFDKSKAIQGFRLAESRGGLTISESFNVSDFIPVKANTSYIKSGHTTNNSRLVIYDRNKNYINGYVSRDTVVTTLDTAFIRMSYDYINENSVIIEEGTVATPYEPYTESTQYLPNVGELRSLPSDVCDEIKVSGGKAELIKRVSDTMEELAEPNITPIEVSGILLSNPSGTVYIENVVADAGTYTTKFDIKELQLPIKNIDKLIKYDFETGVQTVLDTTLAVINEDKKSFTHPNLTKDDMVFVDYFYDVESTLGETTIEYLDSRHTIKDTTNNKFYSWDIKSTNGVPTVELTEVL